MKRVLLIDDEPEFLELISEILKSHQWDVHCASNGEEGIELAQKVHPNIAICDLMMPKVNGFQFCRTIRHDAELFDCRILITSGRDFQADRESAMEAGANGYLVKPFLEAELLEALDTVTDKNRKKSNSQPSAQKEHSLVPDAISLPAKKTAPNSGIIHPTSFRFWGVRGSIPTPGSETAFYGGNTSCVEFRYGSEIIVLDSGTGIRPLGASLIQEFQQEPIDLTVLISHTHWDHIQGFPFFEPAYNPRNRIRVLGYEGSSQDLKATLTGQMESPYFPIGMKEMPGNIEIEELTQLQFYLGEVEVKTHFLNHPGVCVGYRLNTPAASIAYIPDNELFTRRAYLTKKSTSFEKFEHSFDYAENQESKLAQFIKDVDALIIDSQYDVEEYKTHLGWGHGCLDDVVELAIRANVKQLFLFHHDPSHNDLRIQSMEEHARYIIRTHGAKTPVYAAREGLKISY